MQQGGKHAQGSTARKQGSQEAEAGSTTGADTGIGGTPESLPGRSASALAEEVGRAARAWLRAKLRPLVNLAAPWRAGGTSAGDGPLRAELLSAEQMERHGRALAQVHAWALTDAPDRLLPRLADNRRKLAAVCTSLARGEGAQRRCTPAGEWLLDNNYLLQQEMRAAARYLPTGYSRELPRLRTGPSAGLPRVYDLAEHAVAHGDGRLELDTLRGFFAAYQAIHPLLLGELWAIAIMLRLALVENLRRVAVRVAAARAESHLATEWADRMFEVAAREPKGLILVVADMARSDPPMTPAFVAELVRRLHGHSAALALPLSWLDQRLAETDQATDQLVQAEAQNQAAEQVSVSNSIGSLRLLASTDWPAFVEDLSLVERTLRSDPAGVYGQTDFATRDACRHAVERIARDGEAAEDAVAKAAVALAAESLPGDLRQAHVGYYLTDSGRATLEARVGAVPQARVRLRRWVARHPLAWYAGAIVATTVALPALVLAGAWRASALSLTAMPVGLWVACAVALPLAASQLAVALVNWIAMLLVRPQALPRMDFSAGIPREARTLVVVPTMLDNEAGIAALVDALEVRFLANRDPELRFALLTDHHDAPTQHGEGDERLLGAATAAIEALNAKYPAASAVGGHFFLLHRAREWNARDGVWMGYERKRGKLGDLNALLRGRGAERFARVVGETALLAGVRYVITLDTDTQLPRDAAWKFVATMAHPLNRPRIAGPEESRRVVEGYGILQPRVGVSHTSAHRSRYTRLCGGEPGIDPYTHAASDVYQDLFGEGSFIGKGIYDVDAVERVLEGRLPDNQVLSHDLLEGCYARSGLLSDVELVEDSPARYEADVRRRHRWMRGDWQIVGWLLPWVHLPVADADEGEQASRSVPNPLSALSRAKILDNLRRSLVPGALIALFILGWTVLQPAWLWTLAGAAVLLLPGLLHVAADLVRKPAEHPLAQHLAAAGPSALLAAGRAALALACLPYEAWMSLDAILRSVWRQHWSGRRLLEWQPTQHGEAAHAQSALGDFVATLRRMAIAPGLAAGVFAALLAWRPESLGAALPVLVLWLAAPGIAWWISRPMLRERSKLDEHQVGELRRLARRTWAFFETFVTAQDHFLPPDNMQELPEARVAHRTSPTNIGLSLLAGLAARDFGYITELQLVQRTAATFDTMERLERHHGHFLNWYDTLSLQPLRPAYVSSVDSGNLAGHLLTLRSGLLMLAEQLPQTERLLAGLADTLALVQESAGSELRDPLQRFAIVLAQGLPVAGELRAAEHLLQLASAIVDGAARVVDPQGGESDRWSRALRDQCAAACEEFRTLLEPAPSAVERPWNATALVARRTALQALAERAGLLAEMDPTFLYDAHTHQLAIGYNVDDRRRDTGSYDLLASEARLAVFVGIAQGQLPQQSWFALGRQAAAPSGRPVLLSWSGSMFEYLMPMLVMPSYGGTLLDEAMQAAVETQVRYGRQRGVPWGISESGYNLTDSHLNYQYRAFGVPGLGLQRGLAEDLVVAPYATVMALMVDPAAAAANLQRLARESAAGTFGYYEAIDYTPSRLRRGETRAVVRSYMAHHQGMSLLALAQVLLDAPMQQRFASEPRLRATLLLLQERIPRALALHDEPTPPEARATAEGTETPMRIVSDPDTPAPEVQLLSNGRYHVMLTHAGGGCSRWKELALTRWHEDRTTDAWGSFCYLRDLDTGTFWSTAHQPARWKADHSETIFTEGRAEFRRVDQGIDAYTEVVVSPEDDIELRRLRLTNRSRTRRTIEVTSYTEPVLSSAAADAQHPAFSKLFLQTEIVENPAALLCNRRPRSAQDTSPWMFHLMAVHGAAGGPASHESDRVRFIGRGRSLRRPAALRGTGALSGTSGAVLDPVLATRRVVTLEPEQTAVIDLVWGVAASRDDSLALVRKYMERSIADRVFELAWTHSQVNLRQLNASESDAQLYARLANAVVYSDAHLRAPAAILVRNRRAQSGLWGYAISGDLPIVLLQVSESANIELVRQLVQAHAWWRLKGLPVDLVIWNEERDVYRQRLQEQILGLIAGSIESHEVDRPGGIFVRQAEHIAVEDRVLLQSVARVILSDRMGSLADQVARKRTNERRVAPLAVTRTATPAAARRLPRPDLVFDNGLGGFAPDGREYVIAPQPGERPPAPWVNVIANPRFGTVVSDGGSSYTWCENAHELRLTPWHNDGVTDDCGEVLYLRDEETGAVWNPTSLPMAGDAPAAAPGVTRHGFGYSVFERDEAGIHSELTIFVSTDAAVKFSQLVLRNDSDRPRSLSATAYVEWVLGDMRARTAPHIHTEVAADSGAVLARNRYSNHFGNWLGFLDVDEADRLAGTMTCDRTEFIGRNGSLRHPAALRRAHLSGRSGAGLDPCSAIQVPLRLAPGESRELTFRLGMGRSLDEVQQLVRRFRGRFAVHQALADVHAHWKHMLGAVQVRTPDPALDLLANGWLVYQTMGCRIMARSGHYQSGGAFGFRDQLQDAMAMIHARPVVLREHLLACAGRQFVEGDVQHWWHPPSGHGVRTRISDDYLWLPLALCRYVDATNDTGVLDEPVTFLEGRTLGAEEESYYDLPARSARSASLYEHAALAVQHGLRFGEHGLPLMGSGDWNDGMNLVGHAGRGESVWLGFFLCEVLRRFAPLARRRGDEALAQRCEADGAALAERLEASAWDGEWYRRAWFDDGTPLGTMGGAECRIDSIAQSWSVLSGVADARRGPQAMDSLATRLVRPEARIVQLLDPPFDGKGPDPGYIAGYLPGVRENGGQYTHAAVWAAMAFAALGDGARAWALMDMINPVNHGRTPGEVAVYQVEPYVAAADVYSMPPHTGRGGWSWYTGSAGWMYRLILESLLGLRLHTDDTGARLHITPCLPEGWTGFGVDYRFRETTYRIEVTLGDIGAMQTVEVDGQVVTGDGIGIALVDDRGTHEVRLRTARSKPLPGL